jgi:hypothetical protein
MLKQLCFIFILFSNLSACSHSDINDYTDREPKLNVVDFFDGKLTAYGVVKDRWGKVIRYFTADIEASWSNGVGTLDESFVFDDGEHQKRIWTLTPDKNYGYIASANDVIGEWPMTAKGNALFMKYVLRIELDSSSTLDVKVDDKMFLVSESHIINESKMSKWGIDVGSVQLSIIKQD